MSGWSRDALLAPVSEDAPAGPNLEYDSDFLALNEAAAGKPERQSGNAVIPAEEPDWRDVEQRAAALLRRTRDLRVLVHLAIAGLHRTGLPAYAAVLSATQALVAEQWESVHPQLDPEDDNDPTARKNILENLAQNRLVLRHIQQLPLTTARTARLTWRDLSLATGKLMPERGEAKPTMDAVRGAFNDTDPAHLAAMRAACAEILDATKTIGRIFTDRASFDSAPDFKDLPKLARDIAEFIDANRPAGAAEAPAEAAPTETSMDADGATPTPAPRAAGTGSSAVTEIATRAEAIRMLGLICQYYRRYEPSSPLPMLLDRALRLADKDFLEILRDLAPDGLMQAQNVIGTRDE